MAGYSPPSFTTEPRTSQYFANGIPVANGAGVQPVDCSTLSQVAEWLPTLVGGVELGAGGLYGNGITLTERGFYVVTAYFSAQITAGATLGNTVGFLFDFDSFYLRQSYAEVVIAAAHVGNAVTRALTLAAWSDVAGAPPLPQITIAIQQSIQAAPLPVDLVLFIDKVVTTEAVVI